MKSAERIFIVPTWAGLVLGALALALFVAGYLAEGVAAPAQVLVISLVVCGIVALFRSNDNLRGIEITSCRTEPVAAGDEALVELAVTNRSVRERLGLKVRVRHGWKLVGSGWIPVLRAGETRMVDVRLPTSRRGGFPIPAIWVSSNLPVGACFAWKVFSNGASFYAYPRGRSWRPAPAGEGAPNEPGTNARPGPEDVSGHRAYEPGDLIARMDWKIFARTGRLAVRTFDARAGEPVLLRWEDTGFLASGEDRLEQLSFWVSECLRVRRAFELRLGRGTFSHHNPAACRVALATFREEA